MCPMPLSRAVAMGPHKETEEKGNSVSVCVVSYKIHITERCIFSLVILQEPSRMVKHMRTYVTPNCLRC